MGQSGGSALLSGLFAGRGSLATTPLFGLRRTPSVDSGIFDQLGSGLNASWSILSEAAEARVQQADRTVDGRNSSSFIDGGAQNTVTYCVVGSLGGKATRRIPSVNRVPARGQIEPRECRES